MSKQEKAVNYVIVAEPASDTLKAALDLVRQQPGQDNLSVIYAANQSETVNYVTAHSPCLVMFSLLESNHLVAGLSLLNAISAKVEQKEVKVIALTKIHNPKLLKVLEKQKVSVVISEPIAMRTLMFKLLLQIKSLDVIRKTIEQKIKQNEKIQFRNNAEDIKDSQDESALRFKRAENAAQKNLIMSGEGAASDHPEVKAGTTDPRETFQKVTTEEIKSSSMAVERRDPTTKTNGPSPKNTGEAESTVPAEVDKDRKSFTADKKTPWAQSAGRISRSVDAINESRGAAEAGEKKKLGGNSFSKSDVHSEEKKKELLEKKLERMREQKVKQIAREDRAIKSKEESAARAKLQTEENEKRERARGERIERQRAEKEKLAKAAAEEKSGAADRDLSGRARPGQSEPAKDPPEARDHTGEVSPGVEPKSRSRSLAHPSESAGPAAAARRERPEDSSAGAKVDPSKSEKISAKNLAEVVSETEGDETESSAERKPMGKQAAANAEDHFEPPESKLKKNQRKRKQKKAVSSYLEEMLRQSKTLNDPIDPATVVAAELPTADDGGSESNGSELTDPGADLPEVIKPTTEVQIEADGKISTENETKKSNNSARPPSLHEEKAETPSREIGIGPELANVEEGISSFEFGETADSSSWSDLDRLEKSKREKSKRGFSDNFEESSFAWNAKGQKTKRAGQRESEKIPEVLLAKSQITPDPGSWVKVGKFYVYCNDSLYSSPINRLADALPLCVYEGDTKPASRGIFWLFERQKPLIAEVEAEIDPAVVKFLGKFFRSKSLGAAEEKPSAVAADSSTSEEIGSRSAADRKRFDSDIPEELSSQPKENQIPGAAADSIDVQVKDPRRENAGFDGAALDSSNFAEAPSVTPGEINAAAAQAESENSGGNPEILDALPEKKRRSSGIDGRIRALSESLEKQARELSESMAEPSASQAKVIAKEEVATQLADQRTREEDAGALIGKPAPKKVSPVTNGVTTENIERAPRPVPALPEPDVSHGEGKKKLPALIGDLLSRLSRKRPSGDDLIKAPNLSLEKKPGDRQLPFLRQGRPNAQRPLPPLADSAPTTSLESAAATKIGTKHEDAEAKDASASATGLIDPGMVSAGSPAAPFAAIASQSGNSSTVTESLKLVPPIIVHAEIPTEIEPSQGALERWQVYRASPPPAPEIRPDPSSRAQEIARQLAKNQRTFLPKLSRGQELALHMASLNSAKLASSGVSRELLNVRARLEIYVPSLIVAAVEVGATGEILVLAGECPFRELTELRAAEDSVWAPNLRPGKSGLVAVARDGKRALREEERLTLERAGAAQSAAA